MRISTLGGLILGISAILFAFIHDGGEPIALLNVSAALIVFGGTLGATLVSFPLHQVRALPNIILQTIREQRSDVPKLIADFSKLSEQARHQGLLSLEEEAQKIDDPFFQKGLLMVVDGIDAEVIRNTLEIEMEATSERHRSNFGMLESMGGFSPTMGIIGTVMGLIHVLSNLDDPSSLGPAIAVAFIATLYGVFSANVLWLPLATKLKVANEEEARFREIIVTGLMSVQAGDNPRITREKLEAFLSAKERRQPKSGAAAAANVPASEPAQFGR